MHSAVCTMCSVHFLDGEKALEKLLNQSKTKHEKRKLVNYVLFILVEDNKKIICTQ